jgi:mannose-6-phosphate isomerase-like protein (cupin superfamily)
MSLRERLIKTGAIAAVVVLVIAPVLDRVLFPEPDPPASAYPTVGQVFHSETEGFTQRVLRIDDEYIWSELVLHPHAPGPPAHVHTTFAERFIVAAGEVSMVVDGETRVLHAGEEFLVEPGVAHQPFNASETEAIVRGPLTPDYALPRDFSVFLTQAYGFFDESPANGRPPRALLQMSRFSPRYDSWLAGPPVFMQRALYWVLGPAARVMGYRSYYERYAPGRDISE